MQNKSATGALITPEPRKPDGNVAEALKDAKFARAIR